jgi:hypothetical protein
MWYVWGLVLVLTVVIVVGANLLWNTLFGVALSGSLSASGQDIGNWVLTPDICESGDRRNFFGVRMFTSHDNQLAFVYVEDPLKGRGITVNIPGTDSGFHFGGQACKVLDGSLQRGAKINQVWSVSGTIDVDCQTDGATLKGHVTFENCQ